ncbi:MAG: aminotransferase class V-fold PLP-dependent enzyme, partial [Patescibacteria group bacterium]
MIYLDYAATAPLGPLVLEAMMPYLEEHHGNASSVHRYGQKAREAIDESRNFFMKTLGASLARNIIFTGSGTESCNMGIFGAAFARQDQGKHLVLSAIEHPAVMEAAQHLER